MQKTTLKNINNFLDYLKKGNPELKNTFLFESGVHKRFCIAKKLSFGSLETLTEFLSIEEMNQFLKGYMFKAQKIIKNN